MNWLLMIIIGVVGSVVTLAISYFIWLNTRPKKIVWSAEVYTISDASKPVNDKDGNLIYSMNDLQPFTKDFLEKSIINHKEVYKLQKLGRTTPAVQNDCVENWGNEKRVAVLLKNDSCTILRKGYDSEKGIQIFHPISYDTQNLIKNEITIRQSRKGKERDILQAILPYVAIIGALFMTFGFAYMTISFYLDMSDRINDNIIQRENIMKEITIIQRDGLIEFAEKNVEASKEYRAMIDDLNKEINELKLVLDEKIENNK